VGYQCTDAREVAALHECTESIREHAVELGLAAEREIALGDAARDEIARCSKVIDTERPDIHVAADREQGAGPRVAEQLLVESRRGAEIHRGDAAAERRIDLVQKVGAPRRVAGSIREQSRELLEIDEREPRAVAAHERTARIQEHQLRDAQTHGELATRGWERFTPLDQQCDSRG
jgi:hypothetical protein